MSTPGIKLVWAGYADDAVIGFSERGASRWRDSLPAGTRMLVYETTGKPKGSKAKGTKSLIGEVEVTGTFEEGEAFRAPNEEHDRLLPVKPVIRRADATPVPLDRVREIIDDAQWPRMGETWKPLTDSQYQTLVAALKGG
jgi:hypothetical protein